MLRPIQASRLPDRFYGLLFQTAVSTRFNVKITFHTSFFLLKNRLFVLSLQRLQISFLNY